MNREFGPNSSLFSFFLLTDKDYICYFNGLLNVCIFGILAIFYVLSYYVDYESEDKIKSPNFKIIRRSAGQQHCNMRSDTYNIGNYNRDPEYVVIRHRTYEPNYVAVKTSWYDGFRDTMSDTWAFRKMFPDQVFEFDLKSKDYLEKIPSKKYVSGKKYILAGLEKKDFTFEISLSAFIQVCTPNKIHFNTDREVRKEMISRAINRMSTVNADTTRFIARTEEDLTYQTNVMLATQHFAMAYVDSVTNDDFAESMKDFY